jgi:hypothetical protein
MAHFAEINAQGRVLRVIVISNADAQAHDQDDEAAGMAFCQSLLVLLRAGCKPATRAKSVAALPALAIAMMPSAMPLSRRSHYHRGAWMKPLHGLRPYGR